MGFEWMERFPHAAEHAEHDEKRIGTKKASRP